MRDAGRITNETFTKLAAAYANNAVETKNLKDLDAAYASILTGAVAPSLRTAAKEHKARSDGAGVAAKALRELIAAERELMQTIEESTRVYLKVIDDQARALGKSAVEKQKKAWEEFEGAVSQAKLDDPLLKAARATADWNAQLDATLQRLDQIGGVGGDIAKVFKVLSGQGGKLGGPLGALLDTVGGVQWSTIDQNTGDRSIHVLSDEIARIFTREGAFGKTMKDLMHGAGTGVAVGSVLFGQNNQGAQIGGALGGALGEVAGKAIGKGMSGVLGAAMGPLGGVLGGVLGSVIGGLFGKKPSGQGTISNTGVTSSANDAGIKGSIDSFGLGTQTAISGIAERLGGDVGKYSVGVGRYKDYYQVSRTANDPLLGRAHYARDSANDVYDGLDPQAALRAAIAEAIQHVGIHLHNQALARHVER